MKISFDFDDTLDCRRVQRSAKFLIDQGCDVYIVTARPHESMVSFGGDGWNDDLYSIADSLGINRGRIHFCNLTPKYKFFKANNFDIHLDDDLEEWKEINKHTNTKCYKLWDEYHDFLMDIRPEKQPSVTRYSTE